MHFLVYMYYTHSGYQTPIFGKNCAYYIRIFTVYCMFVSLRYLEGKHLDQHEIWQIGLS